MRLEFEESGGFPVAVVTLSRRNLRTLLTKLNEPESLRTLSINRIPETGHILVVRAEEDDVHYSNVERVAARCINKPGPVSSTTATLMVSIEEVEDIAVKSEHNGYLPPFSEGEK